MSQSQARAKRQPTKRPENVKARPKKELVNEIDDILDDIDSVLEGQEVLAHYRQKNGE